MTTTAPPSLASGHVGINVTDLARSVDFYAAAVGLEVMGRSDSGDQPYAFMGSGGTLLVTLWQQSQGAFDGSRPGLHHLALQVPHAEAVAAAEQRLRDAGATFIHDGIRSHAEGGDSGGIWFTDPDGTRLEIYTASGMAGMPPATSGAPTCGFF